MKIKWMNLIHYVMPTIIMFFGFVILQSLRVYNGLELTDFYKTTRLIIALGGTIIMMQGVCQLQNVLFVVDIFEKEKK